MKTLKRSVALCIVFVMIFSIVGLSNAKAAITNYGIEVMGKMVDSENYSDVLGDGTVKYDVETDTLTLDNCNLVEPKNGSHYGIIVYSSSPATTIELIGENTIKGTKALKKGIYFYKEGTCKIEGEGSLK